MLSLLVKNDKILSLRLTPAAIVPLHLRQYSEPIEQHITQSEKSADDVMKLC